MIHIVYFLLLLCYTSTNMIHGAYSETTTESSIPSNTAIFDSQQQSASSSSNAWKCLLKVTETNWDFLQIAKIKRTTRSLIASDDEDSTVFDQKLDDQETFTSEKPPRKKGRVNKEDVPNNIYFIIACDYCSPIKQFQSRRKFDLISSFKNHVRKNHSDKTNQETQIYINEHLQKPKLLVKFSVPCPESECKHITRSYQSRDLKRNLFNHISKLHSKNKNNYSKISIAAHVENNCKQTLVSTQKQLNPHKKNPVIIERQSTTQSPDNGCFTIVCDNCSQKQLFKSIRKPNLINNFKRHLNKKHPHLTEEQTKIYIHKHLQESKLFLKFSVPCPESECKHITSSAQRSYLDRNLFRHISTLHSKNKDNHSTKSIATYVKNHFKQTLVPVDKQLKNIKRKKIDTTEQQSTRENSLIIVLPPLKKKKPPIKFDDEDSTVFDQEFDDQEAFISEQPPSKKRKVNKEDVPDNACFTITCIHCFFKKQIKAQLKHNLISNFKKHVRKKHQNITEEQTKNYISNYLHKPKQRLEFSVPCPESVCEHRLHSYRKLDLKGCLSSHVFTQHPKNINYSKKSLATYVDNYYKRRLIPA